ncbi:uncharacterized protein LOC143317060 [Chaetodon auriga]|uniref:uncharacterized protein LOC143317060 n=1 Tax=Chaetodon auriga TaxID=39042 RepID=UPI004032BE12
MKSWSRLCFLVLAVSSVSRGQNGTAAVSHDEDHKEKTDPPLPSVNTPLSPDETENEARRLTASLSPQSPTPAKTDLLPTTSTIQETTPITVADVHNAHMNTVNKTKEVNGSTTAMAAVPVSKTEDGKVGVMTEVSTATASTPSEPVENEVSESSWGYLFLVLIVLVIIVLCVILYFLRRAARTYSFDLHRPVPVNHLNEPIGTFEQVYLDDLDQPPPKDHLPTDDLSPPPVANGTTLQSEEKGSNGENAPQEQPAANGTEPSLTSNTSPSPGDDPADKTSSPLSADVFFDATGEDQQNENNNHPSVCLSDPFVEINLDEPAWGDQLLTSPEAPSSVLPFSPFSFSSSSSS